jgi:hypothetical protein
MTETPANQPIDNTRPDGGADPGSFEDAAAGVRGGSRERMDPPGPGGGGPGVGADGETAAREQMRKDLGERRPDAGEDTANALEQDELGATDDPGTNSLGDPKAPS